MARKSYKSYGNYSLSMKHRRRNIQWFIVALVVLIMLLFILLKDKGGEKKQADQTQVTLVNPVLPDNIEIDKEPPVEVEVPVKEPQVNIPAEIEEEPAEEVASAAAPEVKPQESEVIAKIDRPLSEAELLMKQASQDLQRSDYISARDTLNKVLALRITPEERVRVKKEMAKLSEVWMKVAFPGDSLTGSYQVQPGDNLDSIGKAHNVPAEFLMKLNGIDDPRRLQAGQNLKVVNGPFNAIVYKSRFEMDLYLQNTYVKTYGIGIGKIGKDTPTGKWLVKTDGKLIEPDWPRPQDQGGGVVKAGDPEYPLGSRWIAIRGLDESNKDRNGFGIHGTNDPDSIGKRSSLGCVRLYNGDVIEFYDMVMPGVSVIHIRD